jgi:hypothetical protein
MNPKLEPVVYFSLLVIQQEKFHKDHKNNPKDLDTTSLVIDEDDIEIKKEILTKYIP